jgi:hypothetical protein
LPWSSDGDAVHRRDYSRLGYFVDRVVEIIIQLLAEADAVLKAATRLVTSKK